MNTGSVVAIIALGLSILTFVALQLTSSRSSHINREQRLEEAKLECEREKAALRVQLSTLQDENLHLMRKLLGKEG